MKKNLIKKEKAPIKGPSPPLVVENQQTTTFFILMF